MFLTGQMAITESIKMDAYYLRHLSLMRKKFYILTGLSSILNIISRSCYGLQKILSICLGTQMLSFFIHISSYCTTTEGPRNTQLLVREKSVVM